MSTISCRRGAEAGNAVALTLLALAVAILAGVLVLYFIGKNAPQPVAPIQEGESTTSSASVEDDTANPREGWRTYENTDFDFTLEYPPGWIVATGTIGLVPAVSVYPAADATGTPPFSQHSDATHVSVYPEGIPTEGVFGETQQSDVIVPVPGASQKDLVLDSGRPWATIATFDKHPGSWTDAGFVFAAVTIEDATTSCKRGTTVVTDGTCDPLTGDTLVRSGYVDPVLRSAEEEILRSFHFITDTGTSSPSSADVSDLITVDTPKPDDVITSPLTVQGQARGSWYFEASFPVTLETDDGTVLAQVPAQALGDWMTEDFVPFDVSLVFPATTATSGQLVLKRDNPSGLATNDRSLSIPVRFAQ